ncbi:MAG TPA: hypothetical protein VF277_06620 [Steroidobacteraceae bacterium]
MRSSQRVRRLAPLSAGAAALLLAAGCATQRPPAVSAGIPPPPPQLVTAGTPEVPGDCSFRSGRAYRTSYRVQGDGRVDDVVPGPAPACLQLALANWVRGFQYVPPGEPVAAVIDWMGVSGRAPRK